MSGRRRRVRRRVVDIDSGTEDRWRKSSSVKESGASPRNRVGTQLDSPPLDVLAASERDLGAGPPRPIFDLTVDDSDGMNVGEECDAVPHVAVCRGRFAVLAEDTVEHGVSPVSGSSIQTPK